MSIAKKNPPLDANAAGFQARHKSPLGWMFLLLLIVLGSLFWQGVLPNKVVFANDDPLGVLTAEEIQMPAAAKGVWVNLNWLGNESLSPSPDITTLLLFCASPRAFLNSFYPLSLFLAGMGACFCLRKFKLAPAACLLGGLAAALNGEFLSTACWGLASDVIAFGATFFALGLIADASGPRRWIQVILAGMAVGLNVMEAYDVGAIFSVFVAVYALYHWLFLGESGPAMTRIGRGIARVSLLAAAAFFIAFHTVDTLVTTQIQGIAGMQQDEASRNARWDAATQWSVPKAEALGIFIPGLFGYRLDSPHGQNYWGAVGRDPIIARATADLTSPDENARARGSAYLSNPGLLWRFSGTGIYCGVTVVVIALWAAAQSFRKKGSHYSLLQRRAIWFWSALLFVTLLLSFGRYAPFYRLFYSLPYASTIRNPLKFMHVFCWALVILFGYGVHGLVHGCMQNPIHRAGGWLAQFKMWLGRASAFERKWVIVSFAAVPVAFLGWLIYCSAGGALQKTMATIGIDRGNAELATRYSLQTVGWFAFFLAMTVAALAVIFSGQFSGPRAKWGVLLLGSLLVLDLGRANLPWITYWDVDYKYASNPIIRMLAEKPYEHRVAQLPFELPTSEAMARELHLFRDVYGLEWHQQLFPYNNIQSLEMVQEPRVTVDKTEFLLALPYPPVERTPAGMAQLIRTWELMNTRYIVGQGGPLVETINRELDQGRNRFRIAQSFRLELKPGATGPAMVDYTAVPATNGDLAVIEFTGALPRAKLYSSWQCVTNNDACLTLLTSTNFDPQNTVLVSEPGFNGPVPANANQSPGTVEIDPNYKSKRIELSADVKVPAILLVTERYHPNWQVEVDGKPAKLLRCDFIMRGVRLEPGKHQVVMRYVAPMTSFYISLLGVIIGLALCGWLALTRAKSPDPDSPA